MLVVVTGGDGVPAVVVVQIINSGRVGSKKGWSQVNLGHLQS